jgi:type VI secretion system protein VasI
VGQDHIAGQAQGLMKGAMMRGVTIVAFAIILLLTQARAEDDPKACAAISQDAKRLECFDLIFKKSSVTTSSPKSDWVVREEKSKIDDTTNVTLHLKSIEPVRNQYGIKKQIDIVINCREKKTDLYIVFGGYFMSSVQNYGEVTYRIDKKPAVTKHFTESTDHEALGLGGANSISFIKSLFGGSTLFIRATPFNQSSVSAEFNISGLQEAIKPLSKACGWKG